MMIHSKKDEKTQEYKEDVHMLKREDWGFTNPVVSDLYGKPPLVWKDRDIHLVVYETDLENIKKVIPEPLEARTNKVCLAVPF